MMDDDDFDWGEFEAELEFDLREIEFYEAKADEGFEWLDILYDLIGAVERFNSNMESIRLGLQSLGKEEQANSYLNGTLLSGLVSAYESFIHDMFNICCSKSRYTDLALSNISNLNEKDRNYLKVKPGCEKGYLVERLGKVTLYNPVQVARLSLVLFGLKMPELREDHTETLLAQRNRFTHHGGFLNGKQVEINSNYVLAVYAAIHKLVNGYMEVFNKHAGDYCAEAIT